MAARLAVDQVVTGEVGSLAGETLVFVTLLDLKEQRALARTSATLSKGGDAVSSMKQLAIALTQPDAAGADVPLSTLRVALLVDEYDGAGKPIVRRPLETCLNNALLSAGATPLNAAAVRAHTEKDGRERDILSGGLPDASPLPTSTRCSSAPPTTSRRWGRAKNRQGRDGAGRLRVPTRARVVR